MNYDPQDPRISGYVLDELSESERIAFEIELAKSADLRHAVKEVRKTIASLEHSLLTGHQKQASGATPEEHPTDAPAGLRADQREMLEGLATGATAAEGAQENSHAGASGRGEAREKVGRVGGVSARVWPAIGVVAATALVVAALTMPRLSRQLVRVAGLSKTSMDTLSEERERRSALEETAGSSAPAAVLEDIKHSTNPLNQSGPSDRSGPRSRLAGPANVTPDTKAWEAMWGEATPNGSSEARRQKQLAQNASGNETILRGSTAGGTPGIPPVSVEFQRAGTDPEHGEGMQMMGMEVQTADANNDQTTGFEALGGAAPRREGVTGDALYRSAGRKSRGISSRSDGLAASTDEYGVVPQSKRTIRTLSNPRPPRRAGEAEGVPLGRSDHYFEAKPTPPVATSVTMSVAREAIVSDRGRGAGQSGDKFDLIEENDFLQVTDAPLSTFSIDVDTASYAKVRMFLQERNQLPRPDAVRIEELLNYFPYSYRGPNETGLDNTGLDNTERNSADDEVDSASEASIPFAAHQDVVVCPWNNQHQLVRIALKGKEIDRNERPKSNLVFLLDVSGSMDEPNKLPLLKRGMEMLTRELTENDRVAIVVYAGAAGMVLDSTTGDQQDTILQALARLNAGGSTNGGAGIQLAYQTALDHFVEDGVNRVILCTDGDFNVGTTGTDALIRLVEANAKAGIFLSVLGFGMGNHNDSMLEQVSNKGNGNYAFVDTESEARKVLVEQMAGTLVTIAKDVKVQVEFNPALASAYRLIGYENRVLAARDFNDDRKDAGEIGAGHTVTALYEVLPASQSSGGAAVDPLKYQKTANLTPQADSQELLTVKLRYKEPDGQVSRLLTFPLENSSKRLHEADRDFQFAAAVAAFGMLLRNSQHSGNASYETVLEMAAPAAKEDPNGYRREFLGLVRKAAALSGQ